MSSGYDYTKWRNKVNSKIWRKDITQRELAEKVGTSAQTIASILDGKADPSEKLFKAINNYLGI